MIGILHFSGYSAGFIVMAQPGPPRADRGPGASTNITDFRFVNSKTDGENAAVLSELWCDLKKKGLYRNFNGIFDWNLVIFKKKKVF